ncbi:MAG: BspA family leucine-rich repeat surface protein [Clostridia bacterium]|nr:BspA family leucine-rich repeat surface protein [Clostridia bacterium]
MVHGKSKLFLLITVLMAALCALGLAHAESIHSGVWGTCNWDIDSEGVLTIHAGTGADTNNQCPWIEFASEIKAVVATEEVILPSDCSSLLSLGNPYSPGGDVASMNLSGFRTENVVSMKKMFSGCYRLATLDLSSFDTSNVTDMSSMFENASSIKSLDLSSFNTSSVTDMSRMFSGCYWLNSLDLSSFDTSRVTNMSYMFSYMGTQTLDLRDLNTSNVTDMSHMFEESTALTVLDVSGFDTSNVTNMAYMFASCFSLQSLDVSGFNTSNVTSMDHMFYYCGDLKSIDVSHFNTEKVTSMSGMFYLCESLESLDVSSFDTSGVTSMSYMFGECRQLTSIDVSGFNTANVTIMGNMFSNCSSLTALDVSGFDTSKVDWMRGMFWGCTGLTSLDVSGFNTAKSENFSHMFHNCSSLTALDVSGFDTSSATDMSYMFYLCSDLNALDLTSFSTASTTNMESMFDGCGALSSVVTGDSFSFKGNTDHVLATLPGTAWTASDGAVYTPQEIAENRSGLADTYTLSSSAGLASGVWGTCSWEIDNNGVLIIHAGTGTDTNGTSPWTSYAELIREVTATEQIILPADCSGLFTLNYTDALQYRSNIRSINITGFDASGTSNMHGMFEGCYELSSLTMGNLNTDSVTDMGRMFSSCSSLTSIDLSSLNTAHVTDMSSMFNGCSDLVTLDLSSLNTANVTNMGGMFRSCRSLSSLDLSGFNTGNVTNMSYMFNWCLGLSSLDLTSFNTVNVTDMGGMFSGCRGLSSINLSSFHTASVTDMYCMFEYCSGLSSLDLSSFNTASVTDMDSMFRECDALSSITFGDGFSFTGSGNTVLCTLPENTWYGQDGTAYTAAEIAANRNRTADTYTLTNPWALPAPVVTCSNTTRAYQDIILNLSPVEHAVFYQIEYSDYFSREATPGEIVINGSLVTPGEKNITITAYPYQPWVSDTPESPYIPSSTTIELDLSGSPAQMGQLSVTPAEITFGETITFNMENADEIAFGYTVRDLDTNDVLMATGSDIERFPGPTCEFTPIFCGYYDFYVYGIYDGIWTQQSKQTVVVNPLGRLTEPALLLYGKPWTDGMVLPENRRIVYSIDSPDENVSYEARLFKIDGEQEEWIYGDTVDAFSPELTLSQGLEKGQYRVELIADRDGYIRAKASRTFEVGGTSGKCGDNLNWTVENGTLTISGTGDMYDFYDGGAPWLGLDISNVILEEGLTSLGRFSMEYLNIDTVILPNSLTEIDNAFVETPIRSIHIPASVNYISKTEFYPAMNMTSITVDPANPKYTAINGILLEKGTMEIIVVPGGMKHVIVPDGVTNVQDAFNEGQAETIVLPESITQFSCYDFSSVPELKTIFYKGTREQFASIPVSDGPLTTDAVICALKASTNNILTLPEGVSEIEDEAFEGILAEKAVIPDGCVTIGSAVFKDAAALHIAVIPASVTSIGSHAFSGCASDLVLIVEAGSAAEDWAETQGIPCYAQ